MKQKLSWCLLVSVGFLQAWYTQDGPVMVYATDDEARQLVERILDTQHLEHHYVSDLEHTDNNRLHVLAGDAARLPANLPTYYVVYNTRSLTGATAQRVTPVLNQAVAVWDASWDSLGSYRYQVPHYYYLPDDQYEFLDPVLLVCYLPTSALAAYKKIL